MSRFFQVVNLDSAVVETNGQKRGIALGMMDGVHLGHQELIKKVISFCEQENSKKNNTIPCATTFREPPIKWTSKETKIELITTLEERLLLFKQYGIKQAIIFDFEKISNLQSRDYLDKVLKEQLNVSFVSCGNNHKFGSKKEGSAELLKKWGQENNIQVEICDLLKNNSSNKISSSVIRNLLKEAKFKEVFELLEHNFMVYGKVVSGKKLGSKLGFPTLNIEYSPDKVQIPYGVYAAKTRIGNRFYKSAVNLGFAPTINEERKMPILESYLINFDLETSTIEENICVELCEFIRPEKKFKNLDELKSQIQRDLYQISLH